MRYAITGAGGTLGRLAADLLLSEVAPEDVVLVTRRPDELADLAARGADVRQGDFDDPATLATAFAGVDRLLLISTDAIGRRVEQQRAAVDAAVAAGVTSIAYTSLVNPSDSNPAGVAPEHRATEDHLRTSGVAWTFLRNAIYTEMLVPVAQGAAATGTLVTNEGAGRSARVSRADCAAAAVAVLTGSGHEGKAYDITGPEALDVEQRAAIVAELSGRAVEVVHVDDAAWIDGTAEHTGLPRPVAELLATFGIATRQGYDAPVSTAVEDLTGRAPRSIRDVLAEHLAPAGA